MITKFQIRAAIGGLRTNMTEVAAAAGIQRNTLSIFLNGQGDMRASNLTAVESHLEELGVEFLPNNGIRLKRKD